jgi:hypothetical protein
MRRENFEMKERGFCFWNFLDLIFQNLKPEKPLFSFRFLEFKSLLNGRRFVEIGCKKIRRYIFI